LVSNADADADADAGADAGAGVDAVNNMNGPWSTTLTAASGEPTIIALGPVIRTVRQPETADTQ